MVDFDLSEEQRMLQEAANEFAAAEVQPHAEKWDRESSFPLEAIRKAHDLGLLTVMIPEEYGGAELGLADLGVILEECGRTRAPLPVIHTDSW